MPTPAAITGAQVQRLKRRAIARMKVGPARNCSKHQAGAVYLKKRGLPNLLKDISSHFSAGPRSRRTGWRTRWGSVDIARHVKDAA